MMALNKHDVFSSYVKIIQYWIFLLVARVAHVSFSIEYISLLVSLLQLTTEYN